MNMIKSKRTVQAILKSKLKWKAMMQSFLDFQLNEVVFYYVRTTQLNYYNYPSE